MSIYEKLGVRPIINACGTVTRLGGAPLPPNGTQLFDQSGQPRGRITSAVTSPRRGRVGLGYVRREVQPPAELHLGAPDGPIVGIRELVGADWAMS